MQREHDRYLVEVYGMLPIVAAHKQRCGCGRIYKSMPKDVACPILSGAKIVKVEGQWWNVTCADLSRQIKAGIIREDCWNTQHPNPKE